MFFFEAFGPLLNILHCKQILSTFSIHQEDGQEFLTPLGSYAIKT